MKKIESLVISFLFLFMLIHFSSLYAANNVNIRVVFPFTVSNVAIHGWGTNLNLNNNMTQTGRHEFSITIPTDVQDMIFYIDYKVPQYTGNDTIYIAGGNIYAKYDYEDRIPYRFDAKGILYGKVYINNQLIDNSYTVLNTDKNGLNISVKINADGNVIPYPEAENKHLLIDDRIPTEVHHRYAYRNLMLPASYHTKITGWMQAVTDNNNIDSSRIDVDYIRLWGYRGNDSILIDSNEYTEYIPSNDGGLYLRYPFFPKGHDEHTNMPGSVSNGILTFYPSDNIYKVWHWWTKTIVSSDGFNYDDYKLYCRMRIIGHAVAQAGIDFKTNTETNELGVSDWYFPENGEWQIVTFNTKKFITTSLPLLVNKNVACDIKLIYLKNDKTVHLRFSNLTSGNYILNIYNSIGKNIIQKQVNINKISGEIIIPVEINEINTLIYNLDNEKGKSYSGKVII